HRAGARPRTRDAGACRPAGGQSQEKARSLGAALSAARGARRLGRFGQLSLGAGGVGLLDVRAFLTGTIGLAAMPIQDQRMIADLEPQALRHRVLALFDSTVHELLDTAAV